MDTLESSNQIEDELAKALEVSVGSIRGNAQLANFDLWDSLTMVKFAAAISERFGCSLGDEEIGSCETVRELVSLVQKKAASA